MKRLAKNFAPHLERYVFAMHHCRGRTVIDLGGKSGYGALILGYINAIVTVADHMPGELSQITWTDKKILIDFNDGYPEGEWDVAVAFEIIEHVKDPDTFVKNIAEHLPKGGKLIFSVPHMQPHVSHLTLFDRKSIKELISKYLTIEEFYVQDSYIISGKPFQGYPVTYVGVAVK